jgi:hypothetical protein
MTTSKLHPPAPITGSTVLPYPSYRPLVAAYQAAATCLLERDGFTLKIERDLHDWVRHMRQAPGVKFIMPTFNPETHPFEDQPIWLRVTKAGMHEPETVACMAARCFNTQDYHQLLASGVLWFHDGKKPSGFLLDTPGPSGVISHVGGLWVHPDNRGDGLSWIVPRLLGAVTLSAWHQEYHTGLVQEGLVGKGVPGRNYGVGSMDLCIDGWFEPTNRHERIYSAITTRTEMLERMSIDLDQIVRESDKKVRDHAPVTRHRNH